MELSQVYSEFLEKKRFGLNVVTPLALSLDNELRQIEIVFFI